MNNLPTCDVLVPAAAADGPHLPHIQLTERHFPALLPQTGGSRKTCRNCDVCYRKMSKSAETPKALQEPSTAFLPVVSMVQKGPVSCTLLRGVPHREGLLCGLKIQECVQYVVIFFLPCGLSMKLEQCVQLQCDCSPFFCGAADFL